MTIRLVSGLGLKRRIRNNMKKTSINKSAYLITMGILAGIVNSHKELCDLSKKELINKIGNIISLIDEQ